MCKARAFQCCTHMSAADARLKLSTASQAYLALLVVAGQGDAAAVVVDELVWCRDRAGDGPVGGDIPCSFACIWHALFDNAQVASTIEQRHTSTTEQRYRSRDVVGGKDAPVLGDFAHHRQLRIGGVLHAAIALQLVHNWLVDRPAGVRSIDWLYSTRSRALGPQSDRRSRLRNWSSHS